MIQALVFSRNRAFQLDGMLRSFSRHYRGEVAIKVLYRADGEQHVRQYQELVRSGVNFIPRSTVQETLLAAIDPNVPFTGLFVDDNIFVSKFDLGEVVETLNSHPDCLGFSLRLGKNTTYCFTGNFDQPLPNFTSHGNVLLFDWTISAHGFGYPLEISSSIYRTRELLSLLEAPFDNSPNSLELSLANQANRFKVSHPFLACWEQSVVFSAPINLVDPDHNSNRITSELTVEQLDNLFDQGARLDIEYYNGMVSNATHVPVKLVVTDG